jgi:DNA-binding MarR family transcriptional regulator
VQYTQLICNHGIDFLTLPLTGLNIMAMTNEAATNNVTTSYDPLALDQQLCFALYRASNEIIRLYRKALEPFGLTYSQYLVLLVLWEQSPRSVGEIGTLLHLDSGTLTPLLKRMENAGFVSRQRDPGDERRVIITLTSRSHALRQHAETIPQSLLRRVDLPPEEIGSLRNRVIQLVDSIRPEEEAAP